MRLSLPIALTAFLGCLLPPAQARETPLPTLEEALLRHAPGTIDKLHKGKCANVGVLPFEVVDSTGKAVRGTGGFGLAHEVEVALVLGNDFRDPVGILRDAGSLAASIPGASHRSPEGLKKLFAVRYPLAWGNRQEKASAFITGRVVVSKDLRTLTVSLTALRPPSDAPLSLGTVKVRTGVTDLAEMGKSFNLRDAFPLSLTLPGSATPPSTLLLDEKAAAQAAQPDAKHPLEKANSPVDLEVYYDDSKQTISFAGGKAFVPPPEEHQKVKLVLVRRQRSTKTYGVVVKVNGQSTYMKEDARDDQCRRWILRPDTPRLEISGYQRDGKSANDFLVLSAKASKEKAEEYDQDRVGLLNVAIFEEGPAPGEVARSEEEEKEEVMRVSLRHRSLPSGARTVEKLEQLVRKQGGSRQGGLRVRGGLIAPGEASRSAIKEVEFKNPSLVTSYAVRYFSLK